MFKWFVLVLTHSKVLILLFQLMLHISFRMLHVHNVDSKHMNINHCVKNLHLKENP